MMFIAKIELMFANFLIKEVKLFLIKKNNIVDHECCRCLFVGFSMVQVTILSCFCAMKFVTSMLMGSL